MTQSTTTTSNSPLTEVEPDSLNELFQRDPLELSAQDITRIVTVMRRQRLAWEAEENKAKKSGTRANPKAAKLAAKSIKLEDLDLDL